MSAIAGLWRLDDKPDAAADCARMLAAQEVYGPHDGGQRSDGSIVLGRRLFRMLPEDAHDRQPLQSRDGRLMLVADVRLDNRDELVVELGLPTADARELCDTAILLEGLDRWGEGVLDRMVGDFAFALWDALAQKLLLARDFHGQRPLHYYRGQGLFAFASMPKGLHALPEIPYGPDEQRLAEFVALVPYWGSRSFFKNIARVEPAHIVTVTRGGLSSRRYWEPRRPRAVRVRPDDFVEGLRYQLDQATRSRLRGASGAVGSHLSSGFDSSSVTATAARLLTSGKVIAFTAVPREGYDGPDPRNRFGDEGPLAAATAAMYSNIEHVLIRSSEVSPLDGLDRNFLLFGRPMLNLCNMVWMCAINQAARKRKLNIMLIGQRGNMTLSYDGFELLPELLRAGHFVRLWREAAKLVENTNMRWRGALVKILGPFAPAWLWRWANETFLGRKQDVLRYTAIRAECFAGLDLAALARERDFDLFNRPHKDGFAMRKWVLDREDLANNYKGMLAGWGIDYRDPTADKRLVEYCMSIPTEQYCANGVTRALGKRALADRLPQAVLNEEKKGYQSIDWHEALTAHRADLVTELSRLTVCAPATKILDIDRMKSLVENWPTSGWEREAISQPYRFALLRGISAGHFLRKASGANQ